ncbi:MAG: hypothetical protein HY703_11970 [Gemmatimonadetes bacterium]|nr:hypothetical protein [Gemmatimonadota bacterium]
MTESRPNTVVNHGMPAVMIGRPATSTSRAHRSVSDCRTAALKNSSSVRIRVLPSHHAS